MKVVGRLPARVGQLPRRRFHGSGTRLRVSSHSFLGLPTIRNELCQAGRRVHVLALVSVYGMMSQAVGRRTHELAVHRALGGGTGDVLRMVLRLGLCTILAGLILSLAGAVAATRVLAGFL